MRKTKIEIRGKSYDCYSIENVIVGSGAAGLNAAVSLCKEGKSDIAIITEGRAMGTSRNTGSDKQTYYKLSTSGGDSDSVRQMAQTLYDGLCMDGDLAMVEASTSARAFFHLVDIGVPFPHNAFGEYVGYKTDHDPFSRGTSAGPLTSKFMTEALWKEVERCGIDVFDGYQVIELLKEEGDGCDRVRGLVTVTNKGGIGTYVFFSVNNVIYATGGEAGMYQTSVYPVSQTGGMGTAFRMGARGKNLTESQYGLASIKFRWNVSGTYQQVIPRYVSTDQNGNDEREFLDEYFADASSLTNAIFLKGYQWPFDPRKIENQGSSLIDVLVYQETVLRGRRVFMDFRRNPSCCERNGEFDFSILKEEAYQYLNNSHSLFGTPIQRLEHMNEAAIELYRSHGIDLYSENLEVAVCAQHNNGGLAGNLWWESEIRHFFPVGEVNGTHGVYRPGGTALNAGQVGSLRAAQYISKAYAVDETLSEQAFIDQFSEKLRSVVAFGEDALTAGDRELFDLPSEYVKMRSRMTKYGANIRSKAGAETGLLQAKAQLSALESGRIESRTELGRYYRLRDLLVSQIVYLTAIEDYIEKGGQSRGSYLIYREDGQKPLDSVDESFRFLTEESDCMSKIQEICYADGECKIEWREVRPLPDSDIWFENVWKDYKENKIYN